jgi:predicted RNase H-like HicB family nuclease
MAGVRARRAGSATGGVVRYKHSLNRRGAFDPRHFMILKVLFEPAEEVGYTVYVPALPGCISEGDTLDEARRNIREAIELYLEPVEEPVFPEGGFVEEIAV